MRAAALEPPARASMRALNTSYTTFHQFIFFMIMLNHKPFQNQRAEEIGRPPHAPSLALGRT